MRCNHVPRGFLVGGSSSGFQFEMGDPHGKYIDPNTDWYKWVHDPYNIKKGLVSGDLPEKGIDYFTRYKQDHRLAMEIGLNTYRIGIEWSRIFPSPTKDIEVDIQINSDGYVERVKVDDIDMEKLDKKADANSIKHYRNIVEDLRNRGFRVIICLNHFTLPLWIHDPISARDSGLKKGPLGWLDKTSVIEFTKYVAYIAYKFGDLVDHWATFNEPVIVAETGYLKMETFPPYYRDMGFPPRLKRSAFGKALINIIYAHVNAYEAIKIWDREEAYEDSGTPASVGLIHNIMPIQPLRKDNDTDVLTAAFMNHIHNKYILEAAVNGWLDKNFDMKKDGDEYMPRLRGHLDWLGVNYYCRVVVTGRLRFLAKLVYGLPAFFNPVPGYGFTAGEVKRERSLDGYPITDIGWEIYPIGLKEALEIADKYGKPIIVTENGLADKSDRYRSGFIVSHLKVLEDVINEKNINIFGYLHWALTDNYEWSHGFKMRFGLYYVDLNTEERVARPSVKIYKNVVEKGRVARDLLEKYKLR